MADPTKLGQTALKECPLGTTVTIPKGKICLTFDDGPEPGTQDVLDALLATESKAVFFLTGKNMGTSKSLKVEQRRLVQAELEAGHEIGNHGFKHEYTYKSIPEQFSDNEAHFTELLGKPIKFRIARVPGGGFSKKMIQIVTEQLKLVNCNWALEFGPSGLNTSLDTGPTSFQKVPLGELHVTKDAQPSSATLILFHDRHWKGKKDLLIQVIKKLKIANEMVLFSELEKYVKEAETKAAQLHKEAQSLKDKAQAEDKAGHKDQASALTCKKQEVEKSETYYSNIVKHFYEQVTMPVP